MMFQLLLDIRTSAIYIEWSLGSSTVVRVYNTVVDSNVKNIELGLMLENIYLSSLFRSIQFSSNSLSNSNTNMTLIFEDPPNMNELKFPLSMASALGKKLTEKLEVLPKYSIKMSSSILNSDAQLIKPQVSMHFWIKNCLNPSSLTINLLLGFEALFLSNTPFKFLDRLLSVYIFKDISGFLKMTWNLSDRPQSDGDWTCLKDGFLLIILSVHEVNVSNDHFGISLNQSFENINLKEHVGRVVRRSRENKGIWPLKMSAPEINSFDWQIYPDYSFGYKSLFSIQLRSLRYNIIFVSRKPLLIVCLFLIPSKVAKIMNQLAFLFLILFMLVKS